MGRKVGARKSTKVTRVTKVTASTQAKLIEGALELQRQKGELITWERRMTLLNFSAQVCGPDTHPNEIMQFAGKFERFVLTAETPPAEVTALTVTPKDERQSQLAETVQHMREKRQQSKGFVDPPGT